MGQIRPTGFEPEAASGSMVAVPPGRAMAIDVLEAIEVEDSTQWIRIRGTELSNPVLLLIQQGPGLPMINEARRFGRLLGLEQEFTVVYWDQRGCGRSLRGMADSAAVGLEPMVGDAVRILELLRERFGGPSHVVGFSWGATVGAHAATRRPDLVETLLAVSLDVDGVAAANHAYEFALDAARERGNRRAIRQLEATGPPPHLSAKQFATRARWAMNFGGVTRGESYGGMVRELLASLVRSSDYTIGDVVRTVRGLSKPPVALLDDNANLDLARTLPRIDVPVVFAQGRLDHVGDGDALQRYARAVDAPSKHLVWFERSAHTPQLDEPEKFHDLVLQVRDGRLDERGVASISDDPGGRS
jgi:pimeloyl-ACP methyl ester carboxylesterase